MALDQRKYEHKHEAVLRDVRPLWTRIGDAMSTTTYSSAVFIMAGGGILWNDWALAFCRSHHGLSRPIFLVADHA